MRSLLTCLGIIIGIAAVIAHDGNRARLDPFEQTIASLGANLIQIEPGSSSSSGVHSGAAGPADDDAPGLRGHPPGMQRGGPRGSPAWIAACRSSTPTGTGSPENPWHDAGLFGHPAMGPISEGEPFTADDVTRTAAVCLMGQTAVPRIFGTNRRSERKSASEVWP